MNWPAGSSHHIAGQSLHVVTDPLGTPRELVSDDGEVVWAGQLRTWGRLDRWVVKESDTRLARRLPQGYRAAANDPYIEVELRFQNQWEDPESGLYYNYQRYYDPDTGQYLSPDPIGLRGGLRPHGYVHNPVGWVDPWGLAGCPPEGNVPDSAASAIHPGRLAAESSEVSQESIIRALRQSGSVEGAATAKLMKRGDVNVRLVPTDPWGGGAAGRAPFGSDTVYLSLDKLSSPASAAGVAAHETRHVLQNLTPQTYRQVHELQAYQWQRAVDPAFNMSDDAISRFIHTHPLYRNVPPSLTGGR